DGVGMLGPVLLDCSYHPGPYGGSVQSVITAVLLLVGDDDTFLWTNRLASNTLKEFPGKGGGSRIA
ncbi:hypothetical protein A2U01_0020485, partial [Trifolium medium]|nr:hypothetical protein [Trifolium medium]